MLLNNTCSCFKPSINLAVSASKKKSRASKKKKSRQQKIVALTGKKVFAKRYIPNMMIYARVFGTNRAPYLHEQVMSKF